MMFGRRPFTDAVHFYFDRSLALIGYVALSYLFGLAVTFILILILTFTAGPLQYAGLDRGTFAFLFLFIVGFLGVGLTLSIPVFLTVAVLTLIFQRQILNHLLAWTLVAPLLVVMVFIASSIFIASTYSPALHPAQIAGYGIVVFVCAALASTRFYFLVKNSCWLDPN
jgi:hypothetical protein